MSTGMDKASNESGLRGNRSSLLSTSDVACLDAEELGGRGHINKETKEESTRKKKTEPEVEGPGSQV